MNRIFARFVGPLTALSLLAGACADDGGGDGSGGPTQAATNSVGSAQALGSAVDDPESEAPLGGAMNLYANLQQMSSAAQARQAQSGGLASYRAPLATLHAALDAGCLDQDPSAGQVTYDDCQVEGATFNGTISRAGDDVTIDLTIDIDPSASAAAAGAPQGVGSVQSVRVTEKGTLTITDTVLDGTLDVDVTIAMDLAGVPGAPSGLPGGGSVNVTTTLKAIFDVTLDAGCAVGGTLQVDSDIAGLPSASGSQSTSTTATFGPNCGDATVE